MLFWTRVGNTAVWSVCFSERWADRLSFQLSTGELQRFLQEQRNVLHVSHIDPRPRWQGTGSQDPSWLPATRISPSAVYGTTWEQSAGSRAPDALENTGCIAARAPLQWQKQQSSWAASMATTPPNPRQRPASFWEQQVTDVCAAVFPMSEWKIFYPPYIKCNKQKYCLKSIIELMSCILFTNILFVLFSPPLI